MTDNWGKSYGQSDISFFLNSQHILLAISSAAHDDTHIWKLHTGDAEWTERPGPKANCWG